MIGGPNDILIESQIVRNEARSRDKDLREREPNYAAPSPGKSHGMEPKLAIPSNMHEPMPIGATEDNGGHYASQRAPAAHIASAAPTPRRGPAAPGKPGPMPERAGPANRQAKPQMPKPSLNGLSPSSAAGSEQASAFLRWPARTPTPPQAPAPRQVKRPALGPAPAPATHARPPFASEAPAAAWEPVPSLEGLESLEDEMAKLLGRGGPGKP